MLMVKCALCKNKDCYGGKDCFSIKDKIEYSGDDLRSMEVSASIESRYYMEKTRLEELIIYAKEMGYSKLGLAFCVGFEKEASIVNRILSKDFDVCSVCCKVGGIPKSKYGLEQLHGDGFEATCNPLGQAMIMNQEKTELNIILGLCIGHDIVFTNNSNAPVTTFAVKDRVLTHNPLGAIYSRYYRKKRFGLDD